MLLPKTNNEYVEKLIQLRKENNLTQEELAKLFGTSRSTISSLEREVKIFSIKEKERIEEIFENSEFSFNFKEKNQNDKKETKGLIQSDKKEEKELFEKENNKYVEKLTQLRKENNLTQEELGKMFETSKWIISNLERKVRFFSNEEKEKIDKILESPEILLNF